MDTKNRLTDVRGDGFGKFLINDEKIKQKKTHKHRQIHGNQRREGGGMRQKKKKLIIDGKSLDFK